MRQPAPVGWWWISTREMTFAVDVDAHGRVLRSAPIARAFIGQPIDNLLLWARRQGGLRAEYQEIER